MSLDSLISEKKEEIKKLRREKRKNYDKWYYENKTKPKRLSLRK
jgi:hypothetical protein